MRFAAPEQRRNARRPRSRRAEISEIRRALSGALPKARRRIGGVLEIAFQKTESKDDKPLRLPCGGSRHFVLRAVQRTQPEPDYRRGRTGDDPVFVSLDGDIPRHLFLPAGYDLLCGGL